MFVFYRIQTFIISNFVYIRDMLVIANSYSQI